MKNLMKRVLGCMGIACVASVVLFASVTSARADTITLQSGEEITGVIEREEGDIIVIRVTRDGKEERVFLSKGEVLKLVRSVATGEKPAEKTSEKGSDAPAGKAEPAQSSATNASTGSQARALSGRPTRVALLNFGAPSDWKLGETNTVGVVAISRHFREALPLLKKENVEVVIIRVNSPGGYLMEVGPFHQVFREYKKNFRCAVWVEWGISAACMSPWIFEDIYMMPEAAFGGATAYFGPGIPMEGIELERMLYEMEIASREGNKHIFISKSTQLLKPLSINVDENGNITYFQDETGQIVINRGDKVLTMTSVQAKQAGVSKGTAATFKELMDIMGISEWEMAGKEAMAHMDSGIRRMHRASQEIAVARVKYDIAVSGAAGSRDPDVRRREVGVARQHLNRIRRWMQENVLLGGDAGINDMGWFTQQEQILTDLLRQVQGTR
jgi:hypothetical protein